MGLKGAAKVKRLAWEGVGAGAMAVAEAPIEAAVGFCPLTVFSSVIAGEVNWPTLFSKSITFSLQSMKRGPTVNFVRS